MNRLFLLAIIVALMFGCSKKSTPAPAASSAIVGKWLYKADTARTYHNGTLLQQNVFELNGAPYYQFNNDGSGSTSTLSFNYKLSGSSLIFVYPDQTNSSGFTDTAAVKQLTSSSLVLFFDEKTGTTGDIDENSEIIYMGK
jgi:hypothetical protein